MKKRLLYLIVSMCVVLAILFAPGNGKAVVKYEIHQGAVVHRREARFFNMVVFSHRVEKTRHEYSHQMVDKYYDLFCRIDKNCYGVHEIALDHHSKIELFKELMKARNFREYREMTGAIEIKAVNSAFALILYILSKDQMKREDLGALAAMFNGLFDETNQVDIDGYMKDCLAKMVVSGKCPDEIFGYYQKVARQVQNGVE